VQTVPIDPYNNCFTFRLAPGYKHFLAYCAKLKLDTGSNNKNTLLASATLIEDKEEEEVEKTRSPIQWISAIEKAKQPYSIYKTDWKGCGGNNLCCILSHKDDNKAQKVETNQSTLLQYHH
jgi:hypothetical protein